MTRHHDWHMQATVGTVVKTTDSIDPIAVLTVLPLRRYSSLACLTEIKAYLETNCDSNSKQSFQQVRFACSAHRQHICWRC